MVVDRFAGVWSLDRAIHDAHAGLAGHLSGTARFEPTGDGALSCVEAGVLTFGGDVRPASRRLLLRDVGGPTVDVLFGDGRFFYRFDLVDDRWSGEHPCAEDAYSVEGRFLDVDRFEEVWHAVGPHKDYRLTTTYRRSAG
ncbi:DUF6314 family protein [Cellulomonas sp. P5_C5]